MLRMHRPTHLWATTALAALIAALALALGAPTRAQAAPTVATYPFTPNDNVTDIVATPDHGIWWTSTVSDQIGHLDVAQATPGTANGITHQSTDVNGDGPGSYPGALTLGPDGFLYFSESNGAGSGLNRLDPATGTLSHVTVGPGTPRARAMVFTGGKLWATTSSDTIATYDSGFSYAESAPTSYRYPWGITADAAGNVWVALDGRGNGPTYQSAIGRIPAGGGAMETYITPTVSSIAQQLTVDAEGNVWFVERGTNAIGRLVPSQAVNGTSAGITEFAIPTAPGGTAQQRPNDIATAPDGTIWFTVEDKSFTTPANNQVGSLVPTSGASVAFTMYPAPDAKAYAGITSDANGDIWVIAQDRVGRFIGAAPKGTGGGTGTPTPPTGGNPDGGTGGSTTVVTGTVNVRTAPVIAPNGQSATQRLVCVGLPGSECHVVLNLETREMYSNGGLHTGLKPGIVNVTGGRARPKPPRFRDFNVGRATVVLKPGQTRTVTIRLNRKGKEFLAKYGALPTTLAITQRGAAGAKPKLLKASKLTFKKPKPKPKPRPKRR